MRRQPSPGRRPRKTKNRGEETTVAVKMVTAADNVGRQPLACLT